MTKAFTLVEILVSVAIIFTVGLGLLKVSSNSSFLINTAKAKDAANSEFSLSLVGGYCQESSGGLNLYDVVKESFEIKDDDLITELKKSNFTCESEEALNYDLADNTSLNATTDEIPALSFVINRIQAGINGVAVLGYEMKLQQ
jgi:hypothetical protein